MSVVCSRNPHERAVDRTIYDEGVRVIAGMYRSRLLTAPAGLSTRPTMDRLRETLFNVLAARVAGSFFGDLFAGSGANGIEALSRGAEEVYFIESAPRAVAAIRANLKTLGIESGFRIEAVTVGAWLRRQAGAAGRSGDERTGSTGKLDIVFLDPPYEDEEAYAGTLNLLGGEC
ncbi:MAG TPA: RsmD family RNA methyltransferase, partial [Acidisarcina sp.]